MFMKPASEHNLINRRSSGRFANFRLYSRSRFPRACPLVRSGLVVVDKSVSETMISGLSFATCLSMLAEQPEILEASLSHVRHCSVDTELIDRNNRAKNHFDCIFITTEVYGQLYTSKFLFKNTGSTEYGMSAFTEVDHHVLSDTNPFSVRLVSVSSVPFLFRTRPKKRPMSVREYCCIF